MLTTGGPGFVNTLAGLAHATVNRFPLVVIGGSCRTEHRGRGGFQELDQVGCGAVLPSVCKWSIGCKNIEDVPCHLQKAFQEALRGPPGGVYMDVPANVLESTISRDSVYDWIQDGIPKTVSLPSGVSEASLASIRVMNERLRSSRAPLLIVGKGAAMSCSEETVQAYASYFQLPVLPTPTGRGLVPDTSRWCVASARRRALLEADTVVLLGCRLNWMLHFGDPPRWNPNAYRIAVDIDPSLSESRNIHLPIIGDVQEVLSVALEEEKKIHQGPVTAPCPWVESLLNQAAMRREEMEQEDDETCSASGLKFRPVLKRLRDVLVRWKETRPEGRVMLVSEGSTTMDVSRVCIPVFQPRGRLDAGTWGTMGVGLAYTLSACLAATSLGWQEESLVVGIEGDSAVGFSLAELETMNRYHVSPIILVLNNGGIYTGATGDPPLPTQLSRDTRYHDIMKSCGGNGYFVETYSDLKAVLERVILDHRSASKEPRRATLINVLMDPDDMGGTGHAPVLSLKE